MQYCLKNGITREQLEACGFEVDIDYSDGEHLSYALKSVCEYNGETYQIFIDLQGVITEENVLYWNEDYLLPLDMEPFVQDLIALNIVEEKNER